MWPFRKRERLHITATVGERGQYRFAGRYTQGDKAEFAIGDHPRGHSTEAHAIAAARRARDAKWVFPD